MGKKRERELEERLNAMIRERADRSRKREDALLEALKSMSADEFLIVTRAGHIVNARVIDARVSTESIRTNNGEWPTYVGGRREYSAYVVISPVRDGG